MKSVSSYLTNPVNKLVRAIGVEIVPYSMMLGTHLEHNYHDGFLCATAGFYDGSMDFIGLNDRKGFHNKSADEIVLHELIHFTGTKERLNRKWIINNVLSLRDFSFEMPTKKETQTEEATAQIGALKLALVLGLNPAKFTDNTFEYIKTLPEADLDKAERDSERAVEFILKFIGVEKVA
jgi:antirestriction protein ArdC